MTDTVVVSRLLLIWDCDPPTCTGMRQTDSTDSSPLLRLASKLVEP